MDQENSGQSVKEIPMCELVNIAFGHYCLFLTEDEQHDLSHISCGTRQPVQAILQNYLNLLFGEIHDESLSVVCIHSPGG